ncbi:Uncharacterised protein [Mycobacterium tuberculosis]|nr:Uncharacterised protein [Mycobacterium tuberculosis]
MGAASSALNIEVHSGDTGTRILKPFRSAGDAMALFDDVICLNPLSQILSMATMLDLAICMRIWLPRSPSMAFHTLA